MSWRVAGTSRSGAAFGVGVVEAIWQKGQVVVGYDPARFRKDACGMWIARAEYGSMGQNSWEIDHIRPVVAGGGDELSNLQPLYWENNRHKGDDFPHWYCKVSAA